MEKTYMKTEKRIKLDYIRVLGDYAQFYYRDTAGEARKKLKMLHKRLLTRFLHLSFQIRHLDKSPSFLKFTLWIVIFDFLQKQCR